MFNLTPSDRSLLSLPDLEKIATKTGLVIRKSKKFSPSAFLGTLIEAVASGKASLNQLAGQLKDRTVHAMASQSLHERFSKKSTAFHFMSPSLWKTTNPLKNSSALRRPT